MNQSPDLNILPRLLENVRVCVMKIKLNFILKYTCWSGRLSSRHSETLDSLLSLILQICKHLPPLNFVIMIYHDSLSSVVEHKCRPIVSIIISCTMNMQALR